jgi:hypothetical protein
VESLATQGIRALVVRGFKGGDFGVLPLSLRTPVCHRGGMAPEKLGDPWVAFFLTMRL